MAQALLMRLISLQIIISKIINSAINIPTKTIITIITLTITINPTPTFAKDLGNYGETKEILEEDLLVYFKKKINAVSIKELQMHQEKITKKVIKNIKRPKRVAGITNAKENKTWFYDPTYVVESDISDHIGNMVHKARTKLNPLDYAPFLEEWIIIDGDDLLQIEFAKNNSKPNSKIILINGTPGPREDGLFYYFDQFGEICKQIGITKVPSIIKQSGKLIEVNEMLLN